MKVIELKNYKDKLYSTLSKELADFEKNFLLVAGGTLTFSITFIQDIVKVDKAVSKSLLFISWGFITTSVGILLITFLISSYACDKLWKIVDDFIVENNLFDDQADLTEDQVSKIKKATNTRLYKGKNWLKGLRFTSVVSFIIGIIFLALFVGINIK